jgi:hypothetical protein
MTKITPEQARNAMATMAKDGLSTAVLETLLQKGLTSANLSTALASTPVSATTQSPQQAPVVPAGNASSEKK